ncbi:MAG: replication endonuclease, partial [Janthinobacterium sp.]
SMLNEAPAAMLLAWDAVQKIDGEKRACWAKYLRAQGGALVPRKELVITLAKDEKTVIGRYGETQRITPYGVRCSDLIGVVFKSVRHTWTPVQATGARGVAVGVAVPRTRVNNCTHPDRPAPAMPPAAPMPDLPDEAKTALIAAWAAVNACPYPRLIVPDTPPHEGNGT